MNTVDNIDVLVGDIQAGRWDAVLGAISDIQLDRPVLVDLYEHV